MKKILMPIFLPLAATLLVLLAFSKGGNADSSNSPIEHPLSASTSYITSFLPLTRVSMVEIRPYWIGVAAGDKAVLGGRSFAAVVSVGDSPWYHMITVASVLTDLWYLGGSVAIDIGGGRVYGWGSGEVVELSNDAISVVYTPPEDPNWYRCEGDGEYVYCAHQTSGRWSVLSFETITPTVVYSITGTPANYVWTARNRLFAIVGTVPSQDSVKEYLYLINSVSDTIETRYLWRGQMTYQLLLFPRLDTLYLIDKNRVLYVYSVPTLTLEMTDTLPSGLWVSGYSEDWILGYNQPDRNSPGTLYVYKPQQLQPPVLYKEVYGVESPYNFNGRLAILGEGEAIMDFTSPELPIYPYWDSLGEIKAVEQLGDRLVFVSPRTLSAYNTKNWSENGRYFLSLTEVFTPTTDRDHRLLMVGSEHYYLFDFSSYPPGIVSGTVSPDVSSCYWSIIRGDDVYGVCEIQRKYSSRVYYGRPARMSLSSMQIEVIGPSPMIGPVVTSRGFFGFTQTAEINGDIVVYELDPENLGIVRTSLVDVDMYYIVWRDLVHYDYRAFLSGQEVPYLLWITPIGIDLSVPKAVTVSIPGLYSLVGVDDTYVYLDANRPRALSHDFTRLYFLDFPLGPRPRLASPFLLGDYGSYYEIFLRPSPPEMPYKVYLPLVIRQKP